MAHSSYSISAVLLSAMLLAGGLVSEAEASAWVSIFGVSSDLASGSSDLVVKIKKKKKHDGGDGNDNANQQGEPSPRPSAPRRLRRLNPSPRTSLKSHRRDLTRPSPRPLVS
jgi:hypothetical protein